MYAQRRFPVASLTADVQVGADPHGGGIEAAWLLGSSLLSRECSRAALVFLADASANIARDGSPGRQAGAPYAFAISLQGWPVSITTVFTNNRSQAVRLPADARLPDDVKKVQVRARGLDRIISPVGHTWDEFFQNGPRASDDFMAERADQQQPDREAL
jgi:antitoxin VapB